MADRDFPLHKGARISLRIVGVLLILLIMTAPFGLWVFWRVSRGGLRVTQKDVEARGLVSIGFDFAEVARIGICRIPIIARGLGGALARYKVGGDAAINVCVILKSGKKKQFTISMFEDYEAAMEAISQAAGKPYEQLEMGVFGVKWPEARSAA